MHTIKLFSQNKNMKKSTKILLILTIILLIPDIFLIKYLAEGIVPSEDGFSFTFSALSWVALGFLIAFIVSFIAFYISVLKSLSLSNLLFFSTLPLTLIYGAFIVYVTAVDSLTDVTSQSVRAVLNLNNSANYNSLLWVILATIVYLVLLFTLIIIACKPLKSVQKITQKLGDGRAKFDDFKVGGSKDFQEIEHSLNKINYIYKEKDNKIRVTNLETQKFVPKQFLKFLGKNSITELELGNQVQKTATTLFCDLKTNVSRTLSLEENFNYINSYLKTVAPLVKRYDGFIDKYLGDGVLAVFSKAQNAIECSHAIIKAIQVKNKGQKELPKIDARISITTGDLIFGIVGDEERKSPTIVSDIINLSSKMQEINDYIGTKILISKSTLDILPQNFDFDYRYTGCLSFDDLQISLFESLDYYPKNKREKLKKLKNKFENGVRYYNEGKFNEAKECFEVVLHYVADDNPSYVYFNKSNEKLADVV